MTPLPIRLRASLNANHQLQQTLGRTSQRIDFHPLVRLFIPTAPAVWLISELDTDDQDTFFGLCAPGGMAPHLGHGRLSSLASLARSHGLRLEHALLSASPAPLSAYLARARIAHAVVTQAHPEKSRW